MSAVSQDTAVRVDLGTKSIAVRAGADGSVVVDLSARRRQRDAETQYAPELWEANLLESMGNNAIGDVSWEILEGVRADIASRQEAVDNYNTGLEMLGLKLEDRGLSDKTSKVRHPLLLWAVIKFQANARGEMLPSDGPVKVQTLGTKISPERAEHLQERMNWYLRRRATEYYPDTDRALFYIAYGGTVWKKVYRCPRRRRPVSETVYLPDLIISNDAIDIENAVRVTHQINGVTHAQMMQYVASGYFVDEPISPPIPNPTSSQRAEGMVIGIKPSPTRPQDYTHTLYETTAYLDLERFGLKERGAPDGVPLPYTITMDRDSQQVFRLTRAWRKDDPTFSKKKVFFKWGMIPGIGYLDIGFLHMLGNHTRALTALERILVDSGIFSNFPGGLRSEGTRLETNIVMAGPGEFPAIDIGGAARIQDAIMALPFKGPTTECLALLQELQKQGEAMAGAVDIETGEGTKNTPVGTILASIEQQTQTMTGVHRRLHTSQEEELNALRLLMADQPELLVDPDTPDEAPITEEELRSTALMPVSDPNIPAHVHRLMVAVALDQLQQEHPNVMVEHTVVRRLLDIGRVDNKEELLVPPDLSAKMQSLQQQAQMAAYQQAIQGGQGGQSGATGEDPKVTMAVKGMEIQSKEKLAATDAMVKTQTADKDRASREKLETARILTDSQNRQQDRQGEQQLAASKQASEENLAATKQASDERIAEETRRSQEFQAGFKQKSQDAKDMATMEKDISEAEKDRVSKEDIAAMNDQTQLIIKGIEQEGEPTSGGEARDKKKGP